MNHVADLRLWVHMRTYTDATRDRSTVLGFVQTLEKTYQTNIMQPTPLKIKLKNILHIIVLFQARATPGS